MDAGSLPIREATAGLRPDCRHFRGDRPCAAGLQGTCPPACGHYFAPGRRILVIKLGALGDVIRTAAILPGLKQRWPASEITWVTRSGGLDMLAGHPLIDRLLPFDAETICHLEYEQFDLCLSLDKEPGPAALAMRVRARQRLGIGLSRLGKPLPLNPECREYFLLGLDDDAKFCRNAKSYQQLLYEALGLEYRGQRYRLYPGARRLRSARAFWNRAGLAPQDVLIGLNTGAGRVFANKSWRPEQFAELARRIARQTTWRVALFGGPDERKINRQLAAACPGLIDTGCDHDGLDFAALLRRCNALVTGDTMAMHVAIAADVPCVVLFGPTCPQEIDLYGRGEKLITPLPCAPCYRRRCEKHPSCMDALSVERVLAAVGRWAKQPGPVDEPTLSAVPVCVRARTGREVAT